MGDTSYRTHGLHLSSFAAGGVNAVEGDFTRGIKEIDEGIWLVSFMHYDLGYFDLEQKTSQPVDNPFGPRVSPMS